MLNEDWLTNLETVSRIALNHAKELKVSRSQVHGYVHASICQMPLQEGIRRIFEYPVRYTTSENLLRDGLIDVVWLSKRRVITAIELDSSIRQKSWQKLLTVDAVHRIWIYYGKQSPISRLAQMDVDQKIKLMWLI